MRTWQLTEGLLENYRLPLNPQTPTVRVIELEPVLDLLERWMREAVTESGEHEVEDSVVADTRNLLSSQGRPGPHAAIRLDPESGQR